MFKKFHRFPQLSLAKDLMNSRDVGKIDANIDEVYRQLYTQSYSNLYKFEISLKHIKAVDDICYLSYRSGAKV